MSSRRADLKHRPRAGPVAPCRCNVKRERATCGLCPKHRARLAGEERWWRTTPQFCFILIVRTASQLENSLFSTVEDLLRWEQALFGGKVLSAKSLRLMTTPFKNGYAFGLLVHKRGGRTVVDHAGAVEGFETYLAYYPETGTTVAVLSNLTSSNAAQIGLALGDRVHHRSR